MLLDAQRYFNLLPWSAGCRPMPNQGIVDKGMLPKERARARPQEATKINRSVGAADAARTLRRASSRAPNVTQFASTGQPGDDGEEPVGVG